MHDHTNGTNSFIYERNYEEMIVLLVEYYKQRSEVNIFLYFWILCLFCRFLHTRVLRGLFTNEGKQILKETGFRKNL